MDLVVELRDETLEILEFGFAWGCHFNLKMWGKKERKWVRGLVTNGQKELGESERRLDERFAWDSVWREIEPWLRLLGIRVCPFTAECHFIPRN